MNAASAKEENHSEDRAIAARGKPPSHDESKEPRRIFTSSPLTGFRGDVCWIQNRLHYLGTCGHGHKRSVQGRYLFSRMTLYVRSREVMRGTAVFEDKSTRAKKVRGIP